MRVPGLRLRAFAARCCDQRTMARLVDPILADLQAEYHEAATEGSVWGCRVAWFRAVLALVRVATVHGLDALGWALVGRPYLERRRVGQALLVVCVSMVVLVPTLCASWLVEWGHAGTVKYDALKWGALALLVPAAIPLALPASLTFGLAVGLGQVHTRLRVWVMALSIAASGASWHIVDSVAPASNQAFREAVVAVRGGPEPFRGLHELTLREIRLLRAGATYLPRTMRVSVRELKFEYHTRWAVVCAPVVLSAFVLSVAGGRRRIDAGIAIAVVAGYLAGLRWIAWLIESPVAAAWAPNAVLMIVTFGVIAVRRRRERANERSQDRLVRPRALGL
jgi:hypothetical protein